MRNLYQLLPTHHGEKIPRRTFVNRCLGQPRRRLYRLLGLIVALAMITLILNFIHLRDSPPRRIPNPYADFVSHLWPVGLPNRTDNWENENSKSMRALIACMATQNCSENATTIVILSGPDYTGSIAGNTSGENIWALSVLVALREMGYTTILSPDNHELARAYRQYPDLVKVVFLESNHAKECFKDARCIKTDSHPLGVPAWKLLATHYWAGPDHPLGNGWTLSPEDYSVIAPGSLGAKNVYLGYSVERTCKQIPFVPSSERYNQAYVMAKQLHYFTNGDYTWKNVTFIPPYPLDIVSGIAHDSTNGAASLPEGIIDLGPLDQLEFHEELGRGRVLIGVGHPRLSPSPYDALCMGVPFVNPIVDWDRNDPDNVMKWTTQHDNLKYLKPPYVYNVRRDDEVGLWNAVKAAIEHPIDRYIPPGMTMDALKHRVGEIVERDWKAQAINLLEKREACDNGESFEI